MHARLLLIAIALVCVPSAWAQTNRALVARFDRAYADEEFERAEKIAETLAERHPESSVWAFNAACLNARVGELDEAKVWITACAERGFQGVRSVETDKDLDPIRGTPEFEAALAMIRAAARARMEEFQAAAAEHEPAVWVPAAASAESPVPVVVALHGTGGDGAGMVRALRDACEEVGVAVVAPDALRPSGGGYSWTYRDESEWLILKVVDDAVAGLPVDPGRVILLGFSQGANIAMPMGVDHADRFHAVVPIAGHYERQIVDLESIGDGEAPRYHFLIGAKDPWARTFRAAAAEFRAAGVETELEVVPGMGHSMPSGRGGRVRLARVLEWCLRGVPAPEDGG